jgi:Cytochrome b(N-terminal)/b6/petB
VREAIDRLDPQPAGAQHHAAVVVDAGRRRDRILRRGRDARDRLDSAGRPRPAVSFTYKARLLNRQTHYWAADVFVASIVMHLMRVFFTGAFRKPRERTWLIGLTRGYLGYSLVDDLLSGMGLAIGYAVGLSIPVIGGPLVLAIFGAPFPRKSVFWSRMYIAHVPDPGAARDADRCAPGAGHGAPPLPVQGEPTPHPAPDRGRAAVPGPGPALARADVLRGREPVPAPRACADQPDLAVGTVRAMARHERRPARLVPRLADRGRCA